jgi:hypothetical protein
MRYLKSFENLNQAKSIISKKLEAFDKLKDLLNKNLGYIGKFTEYLMLENIPFESLQDLYNQLLDLKSKAQTFDISKLKYEEVLDKIQLVKNDISVRNLINQFPSEQKLIAREISNNDDGFNLLLKVSNREDISPFITKIARYKNYKDLIDALKIFSKERFNEKEEIKKYIDSSKSRIALEKDNILIIEIKSLEDVQKIGSDTSWCILSQNLYNTYTRGRFQFILIDYSKEEFETKFKIGFTLNKNLTIYACHDILDESCEDYLNSLILKNDIKFSQLLENKSIKPFLISEINRRTTILRLDEITEICKKDQIPDIVKKMVEIDSITSYSKFNILVKILKKYFSDKLYITIDDFKPFEFNSDYLNKIIRSTDIKNIFINANSLDIMNLSNEALKLVIPTLSDKILMNIKLRDLISYEKGLFVYKSKFGNYWLTLNNDKLESVKILSERLNNIYRNNVKQSSDFIDVMCVLNASLGKVLDKNLHLKIRNSTKLEFLNILKIPISPDDVDLGKITKELLQYVIKEQPLKPIYINSYSFEVASYFYEHLKEFKITFQLTYETLKEIRKKIQWVEKNEFYNSLNKKVNNKVIENGNLKFIIN